MKKMYSKNMTIAALLASNLVMGSYILAKEVNIEPFGGKATRARQPAAAAANAKLTVPKRDGEMQECYEALLSRAPHVAEGTVTVQWMSDEQGNMKFLNMLNTDFSDDLFSTCILEKIKQSRFPAAIERAGVLVSHKFNFRKKQARAASQIE